MTVIELIEILNQVVNKDINIIMPVDGGFLSPCIEDSVVGEDNTGEMVFVIMPCYGHSDEPISMDIKAEDFGVEENLN